MAIFADARIPVVFAATPDKSPDDVVLANALAPDPGALATRHPALCPCCAPRGAAAQTLHRLFLARARGDAPPFRRVLVATDPAAEAGLREALMRDPFLSGRYRIDDAGPLPDGGG